MATSMIGVLQGNVLNLDEWIPRLDGRRVRFSLEPLDEAANADESLLAAMAADPEIVAENRAIAHEFAAALRGSITMFCGLGEGGGDRHDDAPH